MVSNTVCIAFKLNIYLVSCPNSHSGPFIILGSHLKTDNEYRYNCSPDYSTKSNITTHEENSSDNDKIQFCENERNRATYFQELEKEKLVREYQSTGIYAFRFNIPKDTKQLQIFAHFSSQSLGSAKTSTTAYTAYSPKSKTCLSSSGSQYYVQVYCSTKEVRIGNYVVFHVKTNFPFSSFDWIIVSKDIIWNSGREIGNNVHPEVKTFSVVVSPEMSPGFHVMVYSRVPSPKCNEVIADSSYVTIDKVSGLHPHKIEFKVRILIYLM